MRVSVRSASPIGVLAAALLLAGCRLPLFTAAPVQTDTLLLLADRDAYARGETARLTLRNVGVPVATSGMLECARFEVWTGAAWELALDGNDRACVEVAQTVRPGETMDGLVTIDVPAGTWRLAQSVAVGGEPGAVKVTTGAFRVTE